jgi:glycerol uptake facilitator protein
MQAYLAEFIGTAILVLLGNGVVANVLLSKTKGHGSGWIVISFGWAMAVFVAVWCVGPISGAHINPAVTLGFAAAGDFAWASVPGYIVAQMLGALVGANLVYAFYGPHYEVTDDADVKLATFCTAPAIRRTGSNLLSEMIGTAVLVLAVLLATEPTLAIAQKLGDQATASNFQNMKIGLGTLGALPVGLLVLAIGLSLGGTTGYAINPARDLSPRLAHALLPVPNKRDSDWSYAWIPVVGPMIGALAAVAIASVLTN